VPEQWPHVREIYERAGFRVDADRGSRTEAVFLAAVEDLPKSAAPPVAGLTVQRTVGINGTRISGCLGDTVIGYIEVDTNLDTGARMSRLGRWSDVGNLVGRAGLPPARRGHLAGRAGRRVAAAR
jgi:hypothetical protein